MDERDELALDGLADELDERLASSLDELADASLEVDAGELGHGGGVLHVPLSG